MRTSLLLAAAGGAGWAFARRRRRQRRLAFGGRTVVITGGSRGLGLALARQFAREGARLALLARDADALARAREDLRDHAADVRTYVCDVRDREAVAHTVAQVRADLGEVDVLVNNAGVIQVGPEEHMTLEDYEAAMAVHVWGPLYLMRGVIPQMKRRGEGRIVNIASVGGLVSVPHLLPYSTSKFALVGLSDGMRAALARHGIRVTTVCPGLMRTGSHPNAFFKGQHEKEYAWFAISDASPLLSTSAEKAARQIVEACRYGDARLTITPQARLLDLAATLFPSLTAAGQALAVRLLPGADAAAGDRRQTGWESPSALAPSVLTRPADEAAVRNNEVPEGAPRGHGAR